VSQPPFAFTFTDGIQRLMLRLMISDHIFALEVLKWIEPTHFTQPALAWLYTQMQIGWSTNQMVPSIVILEDRVRFAPENLTAAIAFEVQQLRGTLRPTEADYVRQQLSTFVRQALFAEAHQETERLFNAGQFEEAFARFRQGAEKLDLVAFEKPDRFVFEKDIEALVAASGRDHQEGRTRAAPTSIPELNRLTKGGVRPGEVWVIFAYAKRGKTTWLVNQGFNAIRMEGMQVLHIALEGAAQQTMLRYGACFADTSYEDLTRGVYGDSRETFREELKGMRARHGDMLVVRTFNEWDFTILDLEQELAVLRAQGFIPDLVIVDYMDLGRARPDVGARSELDHQTGFARDLKRCANKYLFRCWSGWQAQRPKRGTLTREHILYSSEVADAYAKVRIVDAYGSLNATEEEMNNGSMRLFWEGHRDARVGRCWTIQNRWDHMRMGENATPLHLGEDDE
jgi:replicative DNA helicase